MKVLGLKMLSRGGRYLSGISPLINQVEPSIRATLGWRKDIPSCEFSWLDAARAVLDVSKAMLNSAPQNGVRDLRIWSEFSEIKICGDFMSSARYGDTMRCFCTAFIISSDATLTTIEVITRFQSNSHVDCLSSYTSNSRNSSL